MCPVDRRRIINGRRPKEGTRVGIGIRRLGHCEKHVRGCRGEGRPRGMGTVSAGNHTTGMCQNGNVEIKACKMKSLFYLEGCAENWTEQRQENRAKLVTGKGIPGENLEENRHPLPRDLS